MSSNGPRRKRLSVALAARTPDEGPRVRPNYRSQFSRAVEARQRPQHLAHLARSTPGRRGDPSLTGPILRQYTADLRRRYDAVWRVVRETVVERDALRLRGRTPGIGYNLGSIGPLDLRTPLGERAEDFLAWLRRSFEEGLLGLQQGPGATIAGGRRWQEVYLRSAYVQGLRNGNFFMLQGGMNPLPGDMADLVAQGLHHQAVQFHYTRGFTELDGRVTATVQAMARHAADALVAGWSPDRLARSLRTEFVTSMGRARQMASTQLIRVHADAQLNLYSQAGLEGVVGAAEWVTAGDDRVCPECENLDGAEFDIEQARGMIPLHIGCRCIWVPRPAPGRGRREG